MNGMLENRVDSRCSCGLLMVGGTFCENCDRVQPQEIRCPDCDEPGRCTHAPGLRVGTDRDYAFTKAWRRRMLSIY